MDVLAEARAEADQIRRRSRRPIRPPR